MALGLSTEGLEDGDILEGEIVETEEEHLELVTDVMSTNIAQTEAQAELVKDIDFAQKNISDVLKKATEAFEELVAVAKSSETARDFEVAANMMTQIVAANEKYVNMSEKKKFAKEELPTPTGGEGTTNNITQNNLILSTTDMLKMFKGSK